MSIARAKRNRNSTDKAKVREAMLNAATELLVKEGYDKLTLAKVGKQVGFTTTNVYRYFENKDDLVFEALKASFTDFGARMETAYLKPNDGLERIVELGKAYVSFAVEHPVAYRLMFVEKSDYLFAQRPAAGLDKLAYLTQAVQDAMDAAEIRSTNVPALVTMLWALMHGIVSLSQSMIFIEEKQREEALEEAYTSIRLSLKP